jgi:hypothetical protein
MSEVAVYTTSTNLDEALDDLNALKAQGDDVDFHQFTAFGTTPVYVVTRRTKWRTP